MRGADAGAGGMSIRSGMGASSSSSDTFSMQAPALDAAEDGHVEGLQVRRASWREKAQHDVRECGLHGGQGGLAGVDAGHVPEEDPRLSFFAWVQHVVQCSCELQDRGRRDGPAVLRRDVVSALQPGLLRQDGVCLARVYHLHQHVQRVTVRAEP